MTPISVRKPAKVARRSARVSLVLGVLSLGPSCGGGCSKSDPMGSASSADANATPAESERRYDEHSAGPRPEAAWLAEIGTGTEQTVRTCELGFSDRVTDTLCADPARTIDSIQTLYEVLGLADEKERLLATTTHSLALSSRYVTAANPRVIVLMNNQTYSPPPYDKLIAVAFMRGEQMVELVALDTISYDWNFYVLAFEQACNETRCTPEQLLTEQVEHDWTSWTLYAHPDLEDTPLDCISCHALHGRDQHRMFLMRELPDPWIHWGDFHGVDETANCSQDGPKVEGNPGQHIPGEGLDVLLALEGEKGRYAGLPVMELYESESGRLMNDFFVDARLAINDSPYGGDYAQQELELDSARILCEQVKKGTNEIWENYRADMTHRGLPVPYHGADVMDPEKRVEVLADRAAFLASHEADDALDVAQSLMDPEIAEAVGFIPRQQDEAPQILRQMCVRCHSNETPENFKRANFNVEDIEWIDPPTARAIRERIHLPRTSPSRMPPLRVGELPPFAIARIEQYLDEHCSDPEPGACE